MAAKIIVNYPGAHPTVKNDAMRQRVADALGVCPEDVVMLPEVTLSVVEVPTDLTAAREKADKDAAAAQAAADKEKAKAEKAAAELEKARTLADVTARNKPGAVIQSGGAIDYDSWTLDDLRKKATELKIANAATLDKQALIHGIVGQHNKSV